MSSARVAALRVNPSTVLEGVERLCALAGLTQALAPGVATILKDDIGWPFPFPGAHTTPWQLEGTVVALRDAGFDRLSCVRETPDGALVLGRRTPPRYGELLDSLAIPLVNGTRGPLGRLREYRPKAQLHVLHQLFPHGLQLPEYFFGKNVVHLPVIRYQRSTLVAGALRNAFRGLLHRNPDHAGSWLHMALVDLLAIQKEIHPGLFTVVDGTTTTGMPGSPGTSPLVKDVMLASADPVAVDAVAAKLMGFDPMKIGFIRLAQEDGLGVGDPRDIELVGDDLSEEDWGFSVGLGTRVMYGQTSRGGSHGWVERLLLRPPIAKAVERGSGFYHDVHQWRQSERALLARWRHGTRWGALFDAYVHGEHIIGRTRR